MYGWGRNDKGQLGDESLKNKALPGMVVNGEYVLNPNAKVRGLAQTVDITAGRDHALAIAFQLDEAGAYDTFAFAWGSNDAGQLGNGTATDSWRRCGSMTFFTA